MCAPGSSWRHLALLRHGADGAGTSGAARRMAQIVGNFAHQLVPATPVEGFLGPGATAAQVVVGRRAHLLAAEHDPLRLKAAAGADAEALTSVAIAPDAHAPSRAAETERQGSHHGCARRCG